MVRRIALVGAFALVGLACGPNPGTTDAGTGGGSGGGFVGGAGGGSGGGSGGGTGNVGDVQAYCDVVAGKLCDDYIACNRMETSFLADCKTLIGTFYCASLKRSVAAGEQSFDATKGQLCAQDVQNAPTNCEQIGLIGGGSNCNDVVNGLVAAGGQCDDYGDCANGSCQLSADAGSACDGKCSGGAGGGSGGTGTGYPGYPCYSNTVTGCYTPAWCQVATDGGMGTCQNPQGAGSSCSNNRMCGTDLYCNSATAQCTAMPTAGQPCNLSASPYCASSAYCQFGGTANTCVAKGGSGATCTSSAQCQTDFSCYKGQCRAKAVEGGACINYDDCQTSLSCDTVTRLCSKYQSVDAGASCSTTRQCNDSWCQGSSTNPDGGVGQMGVCNSNYAGQTCNGQYSCQNATHCQTPDGGVNGAGTCQTSTTGSVCQYAENCPTNSYCNDFTDRCAARSSAGGPCAPGQDESCVGGYYCITASQDAGVGQCGIPGSVGTSCFVNGDNQCKIPNECINGTCTAIGKQGQPCGIQGQCYDGVCLGGNVDAGTRGTCGGPAADGSPCTQDYECTSQFCDDVRGKCSSVCQ